MLQLRCAALRCGAAQRRAGGSRACSGMSMSMQEMPAREGPMPSSVDTSASTMPSSMGATAMKILCFWFLNADLNCGLNLCRE